MSEHLRILLADGSPEQLHEYSQLVQQLGHEVAGTARTGRLLIERCLELEPDLIISNAFLPELGGIAALNAICRQHPTPAVLVSEYYDEQLIDQAGNDCVMAYLTRPLAEPALHAAILGTIQRFRQVQSLRSELDQCRRTSTDGSYDVFDSNSEVVLP